MALLNIVAPLVFGAKFVFGPAATALLGLTLFVRMARGEPFASMLLQEGRTKRLAAANLSSASALVFEFVLVLIFHNSKASWRQVLGELVALIVTLVVTRKQFRAARGDFAKAVALGAVVLAGAIGAEAVGVGTHLAPSVAAVLGGLTIFGVWRPCSPRLCSTQAIPRSDKRLYRRISLRET